MDKLRRPGRWAETPSERVCKTCATLKPISEFQVQNTDRNGGRATYRHSCKKCESKKAMARVARSRARGVCGHCNIRSPISGYKWCEICRTSQQNSRLKSITILRAAVLLRYGRACVNCGDDRIECLEMDHVGGWGKDHKDKKGRRFAGIELMRWAKENGYPNTLRLLCGSCHTSLSYYGCLPRRPYSSDRLISVAPNSDV
jgi:hypothetical protein